MMNIFSATVFILTLCISTCMLLAWANDLDSSLHSDKDEETATSEYCMLETFQPRCLKNEVILMKSATYGRMRVGRCITAEEIERFGSRYLGCSANVLSILDRKCSGKAECDVRLSDISVENINPCVAGLTVYLEASYKCITNEGRSCTVSVSTNPMHISTSPLSKRNCGTKSQPWYAVAPGGQNIKINLLQFATSNLAEMDDGSQQPCASYGFIVDKAGKRNTSICVGGDIMSRESELYLSTGNAVEIFINQQDQRKPTHWQLILRLETVGCSDVIPPEDAWLKRNDNAIVIGCYSSRHTWHLHCQGSKWIGVFGNCSEESGVGDDFSEETEPVRDTWSDRQVLATVAIGGFTLLICLSILCIGTVCLRRFSDQKTKLPEYNTLNCQSSVLHVDHRLALGISTGLLHGNEMQNAIPPDMPGFPVYIERSDGQNTFVDRINPRDLVSAEEQ